jgi:oxygen-dependent protoporphyrinogen oxidase
MRRVAVIGGGIAGLAAAYEAGRAGAEVVVYEASGRAGGKLRTTTFAGRAVDDGADAFLARVPWGLELCQELGIASELVSPAESAAYVYVDGALRSLPSGTVLGVPTDFAAAEHSGILRGPIRHEPAPQPLAPDTDVSVGELIRAQLGDDVLERLVDPLIGGINAGSSDRLSIRAAAPQLADAAARDGDIVRALRAQPPAQPGPVFYAPLGGMEAIVEALLATGIDVRLRSAVNALDDIDTDATVLATPAWVTAELVRPAVPQAAALLGAIRYASVALVTLAFPSPAVTRPLDGSGFLVPRTEGLLLTAVSWTTSKWAHLRGDDGRVVVRASAGRIDDERIDSLSDGALVEQVVAELQTTMAIVGEPDEVRVNRWVRGFPQYEPGHLERVDAIEREMTAALPSVALAGAAYRGLGVPACIRSGREAARRWS